MESTTLTEKTVRRASRLTVSQAAEATEHAEEMLSRSKQFWYEQDGYDNAAQFDRAVRRCPAHFTWGQRLLAQRVMMDAFMRSIGRCDTSGFLWRVTITIPE